MRSNVLLFCWLCLALCSCSENGSPSGDDGAGAVQTVRATELPELTGALPPLDGGRLEIQTPADWKPGPHEEGFLARLQFEGAEQYPVILIAAADYPGGSTVEDLLQAVNEDLEAEDAKLAVDPKPLEFEGFQGVEYLRRAKTATHELERMVVVRTLGTRRYSLELRALRGTTARFRPYLLAIARGLQPPTEGAQLGAPSETDAADEGAGEDGVPAAGDAPSATEEPAADAP